MTLAQMGIPVIEPVQTRLSPAEAVEQFKAFLASRGYEVPMNIVADGRIQRFSTGQKTKRDDAGWYVLYLDRYCYGVVGDWRSGDSASWYPDVKIKDDPDFQAYRALNAKRRDEEIRQENELVARQVQELWAKLPYASPDHPYLVRKKVPNSPVIRQKDRDLVIPIMDEDGTLVSLEYIHEDGTKSFVYKGRTKGCWCYIPKESPLEPGDKLYLCEGYATAMSVHQATGAGVFVGFYCTNLAPCVKSIRKHLPDNEIIVIADNDENEAGLKGAEATGCRYLLIPEKGMDANDYVNAGFDLRHLINKAFGEHRIKDVRLGLENPHPVRWLIKRWLPRGVFCMVIGKPASGKTFFVLDWMLHLATNMDKWQEYKLHPGPVLYLCGEGEYEIDIRIKGWLLNHGVALSPNAFTIMDDTEDFDTPEGYTRLVGEIDALDLRPAVICFDTLNRYFSGDENKADQSRLFINNAKRLQSRYDCTTIVIHHTGVSEEAQNRGRGSSAWEGATDVMIAAQRDKDVLVVRQLKMKPARRVDGDMFFEFKDVPLPPEWNDEDGETTSTSMLERKEAVDVKSRKDMDQTVLQSDLDELKEALKTAKTKLGPNTEVMFTKLDWKQSMRARGKNENEIKNFFRNDSYRPYMRLVTNGVIRSDNGWVVVTSPEMNMWYMDWLEKDIKAKEEKDDCPF